MQTRTKNIYQIDEHPNKSEVFEWISANWHDLGQYAVEEAIDSLIAFTERMYCDMNYSISIVPDRGEYIKITPKSSFYESPEDYHDIQLYKFWSENDYNISELLDGDCPLTGMYYDEILIDAIRNKSRGGTFQDIMDNAGENLLSSLHNDGEYIYSDAGLLDFCEANDYHFNINGSFAE